MSDLITADEATKLLDEATPGPWEADGDPWNRIIWSSAENRVCFMAHSNGLDDARDIATSNLVAAAPDLARTVIALHAQLADAQAAQAMVAERMTGVYDRDGRMICVGDRIRIDLKSPHTKTEYWYPEYEVVFKAPQFELRHVGGDKDSDTARWYFRVPQPSSTAKIETIRAIAPIDGLALVRELRAESETRHQLHLEQVRITNEWIAECDRLAAANAALEAKVAGLRRDALILLAQIDGVEDATGEAPEGEDALLVAEIRAALATQGAGNG